MRHTTPTRKIVRLAVAAIAAMAIAACTDTGSLLPKSGGAPGEVVVGGDGAEAVEALLEQPVAGLPQDEPAFDVKLLPTDKPDATLRLERNIVLTDIDPLRHTTTTVRYERNVYARPQIIIYVGSPSREALLRDLPHCHLDRLLLRHELAGYASRLDSDTAALAREAARTFGCTIRLPKGMTLNKRGRNFMWFSDNDPRKMGNICLYTSENRDSVMKANIKGATDAMYMATVPGTTTTQTTHDRKGRRVALRRGLWQMEGDAMGGPYMSRTLTLADGRTVTAEAFVFAPGEKKRDKMRMLEASVATLAAATDGRPQ